MANLVSLVAFTLDRNGCQPDYKMLKITSKQKTISLMSRDWDNILLTLTLDCGPLSLV